MLKIDSGVKTLNICTVLQFFGIEVVKLDNSEYKDKISAAFIQTGQVYVTSVISKQLDAACG